MLFGTAVICWFTGASTQAVITGAYRAVAFIKRNMRLDGLARAKHQFKRVVAICTEHAQARPSSLMFRLMKATAGRRR